MSVEFEVAVKCLGAISYYHLGIQVQHPGDQLELEFSSWSLNNWGLGALTLHVVDSPYIIYSWPPHPWNPHICGFTPKGSTNHKSCHIYYWKKSMCKWTQAVQTCIVQGQLCIWESLIYVIWNFLNLGG